MSRAQLNDTARAFSTALREMGEPYRDNAKRLYGWLIAPIAHDLQQAQVDTLITLPDGALRGVPMAALHDGQYFLIEQYALAASPALSVLKPGDTVRGTGKILLTGLTEPGPVLDKHAGRLLNGGTATSADATRQVLAKHYRLSGVGAERRGAQAARPHTEPETPPNLSGRARLERPVRHRG